MLEADDADSSTEIRWRQLTRKQRRVIGTLLEKAFTTPDQYPLTLKATTAGCNQKSNRDPVTSYIEDDVEETLEQLQALGLAGVLHTEGGRTERYRHYLRQQPIKFTEQQLAVLTELLLRGKQQPGELRTRASRMAEIASQEQLRDELDVLIRLGFVRTSGPLDRRGVEVDHTFYPEGENHDEMRPLPMDEAAPSASMGSSASSTSVRSSSSADAGLITRMTGEIADLRRELDDVKESMSELRDQVDDLRRQLS